MKRVQGAVEGDPDALGAVMGDMMADLSRIPRPPAARFEFCQECVRELVVTMKGNSLLGGLSRTEG